MIAHFEGNCKMWGEILVRRGGVRNDSAEQSGATNTERSEQKVQGHVPGQGQGVKPIVGSRGKAPSGV